MPDDNRVTPSGSEGPGGAGGAERPPDRGGADWSGLAEGWALAVLFPAAIGVGFLIGLGADTFFHTGPWGKLVGTGLGVLAAFVQLFRVGLRDDSR